MVAEVNGQNQLLQSYAWGPDGRLLSNTDYTGGTPTNYQVVTDGSGPNGGANSDQHLFESAVARPYNRHRT